MRKMGKKKEKKEGMRYTVADLNGGELFFNVARSKRIERVARPLK